MARPSKSKVDQFVDLYISMDAEERMLACAAARGAERAMRRDGKTPEVSKDAQRSFEELGADRAAEAKGGAE